MVREGKVRERGDSEREGSVGINSTELNYLPLVIIACVYWYYRFNSMCVLVLQVYW